MLQASCARRETRIRVEEHEAPLDPAAVRDRLADCFVVFLPVDERQRYHLYPWLSCEAADISNVPEVTDHYFGDRPRRAVDLERGPLAGAEVRHLKDPLDGVIAGKRFQHTPLHEVP